MQPKSKNSKNNRMPPSCGVPHRASNVWQPLVLPLCSYGEDSSLFIFCPCILFFSRFGSYCPAHENKPRESIVLGVAVLHNGQLKPGTHAHIHKEATLKHCVPPAHCKRMCFFLIQNVSFFSVEARKKTKGGPQVCPRTKKKPLTQHRMGRKVGPAA